MKKVLMYILTVVILLALLAGLAFGAFGALIFIAFSHIPETAKAVLIIGLGAILLAGYIAFAVWLSRRLIGKVPKEEKLLKKAKTPFLVLLPIAAIAILYGAHDTIEHNFEKWQAQRWVAEADEIIRYKNNGDVYITLMGTDLIQSSAAVNYSKMQVAFIYDMSFDYAECFKLKKAGALPDDIIQFKARLSSPGKYLYTFCKSADDHIAAQRTSGIAIEMENGSIYYAPVDDKMLDFDGTRALISKAMEEADLTFTYGTGVYPSRYDMIVETDTVFVDLDDMTMSIVYRSDGSFPETINDVYIRIRQDEPLVKITEDDFPNKSAVYECNGYKLYSYCNQEDKWNNGRNDGLVLITPEGEMYCMSDWGYFYFS